MPSSMTDPRQSSENPDFHSHRFCRNRSGWASIVETTPMGFWCIEIKLVEMVEEDGNVRRGDVNTRESAR
jgi:hypothetical protein